MQNESVPEPTIDIDQQPSDGEDCQETILLGDCVWFLLRMSKMLKIDQRGIYSYTLHQAMILLNKYVIKKGLRESLLE